MLVGRLPIDKKHVPAKAMVLAAGREAFAAADGRAAETADHRRWQHDPDRSLDALADAGVKQAVVNAAWLAERIEDHVADRTRPSVIVSREDEAQRRRRRCPCLNALRRRAVPRAQWRQRVARRHDQHDSRFSRHWDEERMDILLLLYPFAG